MAYLIRPRYRKNGRTKKAAKWYGCYRDEETGRLLRVPLCQDKTAAKVLLADLLRNADRRRAGCGRDEHARRPLIEHSADWRANLVAKDVCPKHVRLTTRRLETLAQRCVFKCLADIDPAKVQHYLAGLRDEGRSPQTRNLYLSSAKSFCNWCCREGRLPASPLAHVRLANTQTDRRHDRRAMSPEELVRLLQAAQDSKQDSYGLLGPERCLLYAVAVGTGLRVSELASLRPSSFLLDGPLPVVRLRAAYAKNRKETVQPLPPVLVPVLRDYLADKPAGQPVWSGTWIDKAARMIRHDLAAAGIPYKTDDGFADFHSLRTLFITSLCRNGTHPRVAQTLARHSTINLTMNAYTRVAEPSLFAAVQHIPGLVVPLVSACTAGTLESGITGSA
jgi:integrase